MVFGPQFDRLRLEKIYLISKGHEIICRIGIRTKIIH